MPARFPCPVILHALILAITLPLTRVAAAATLTVTNLGDSGAPGQLRTLINDAAPGDTIVIPGGIIVLTEAAGGNLEINKNLTIQGEGAGVTIIDGGGTSRVFGVFSGNAIISGLTVRNGNARTETGGGIRVFSGTLTLLNVALSGNTGNAGGAIANSGTASLTNVTISGNTAAGGAGIVNLGTLVLTGSTLSGNATPGVGGGIDNRGILTMVNSTLFGNSAGQGGGGILNLNGTLALTNVTISGNSTLLGGGGGIFNSAGAFAQLKNSIVADSPSGGNCAIFIVADFTSLGHNLDSGSTCGFIGIGDLSNTDPRLGPLQNNGGPTQTQALLSGSPAIDAGDNIGCPATDQRGLRRPQGPACDIGAYEFFQFDPVQASAFVTRLYEQVLGREADPLGLQAFVSQIEQFVSVVPTAFAFFHSQEFLGRGTADEEFLTILYRTFLNREPDPAGFSAFLGDLQSGRLIRDNLLDVFSDSQEFATLANFLPPLDPVTAFVTTLYVRILGRGPDLAGRQAFFAELQRTRMVLPTVQAFLASPEFLARPTTNAEFVTLLFRVFLNRVPDPTGQATFVALLDQGLATRDELVLLFAASPEFQAIQRQLFP